MQLFSIWFIISCIPAEQLKDHNISFNRPGLVFIVFNFKHEPAFNMIRNINNQVSIVKSYTLTGGI